MDERNMLFPAVLPAFPRFCKAFPPLIEDVVGLLLQYGRVVVSGSCHKSYSSPRNFDMSVGNEEVAELVGENTKEDVQKMLRQLPEGEPLAAKIQSTFVAILNNSLLAKKTF